jgi:hypothetical protein
MNAISTTPVGNELDRYAARFLLRWRREIRKHIRQMDESHTIPQRDIWEGFQGIQRAEEGRIIEHSYAEVRKTCAQGKASANVGGGSALDARKLALSRPGLSIELHII